MKSMKIGGWSGKAADGKVVTESLVTIIQYLINNHADQLPNGMTQFRFLQRVASALDKAEKSQFLELEDADCKMLQDLLEKNIPPRWARSKDITSVVEEFLSL